MASILEIATKQNARVILGGDTKQHASVIRGDALRILNTVGGIKLAEVSRIYRQKFEPYREAVQNLSDGDIDQAIEKLNGIDAIKTMKDMSDHDEVVDDYIKAIKNKKTALIISPTHKQGDAVTDRIRTRLKQEKFLGKKEIMITRLRSLSFSEAQKSDSRTFEKVQVVKINQNLRALKRGSSWHVSDIKDGRVSIQNIEGEKKRLPLSKTKHFDAYEESQTPVAKGDKMTITKNGFGKKDRRVDNGMSLEIVSV